MYEAIVGIVVAGYGIASGVHALLNKRDPRSTLGWTVMCLFVPIVGATIYWLIGVNRIRTRARRWQEVGRFSPRRAVRAWGPAVGPLEQQHPKRAETLEALTTISARVTGKPLLHGNRLEPLFNGEQAFPAMLEAIDGATESVYLCTYLFDTDDAGRQFIDALGRAAARGVDVRILVDAIGERYSRPRASRLLRKCEGVKVVRFLPLTLSLRGLRVNLRNHRKIVVVDHHIGFTGGMNIGGRHLVDNDDNPKKTRDIHFRVRGPAVHALQQMFWEDWYFSTGEEPPWDEPPPIPDDCGDAVCRGVPDGPNEDFEVLSWVLVGALSCATERVQIMTPYFIPNRELVGALNAAALRGVTVDVVLPEKSNLPFVDWACNAMLWEVLHYGVRVYHQPGPFDHSKLFVVDGFYSIVGSANLDPRSLRLNFEFNLEVFDDALGAELSAYVESVRARSTRVTRELLDARSFPVKLRDAIAKLTAPYL